MSTNVPALTIGPVGPVLPDESAILAGKQADLQIAFGGDLTPALTTPQGQVASSETTIIGDVYAVVAELIAGVDPATSKGRMQDALGTIYSQSRNPAQATVVVVTCFGRTNTPIPINAKAVDNAGVLWLCTEAGIIPAEGSIDLTFACAVTGPTACPIGFIAKPYQAIPGWDSVTNSAAGVLGNLVESRAEFEFRRRASVASGANGQTGAVLGAVLALPGVLDAWAYQNDDAVTSGATFTASISGHTLTLGALTTGTMAAGQMVVGAGVVQGTLITQDLTGGLFNVSIAQTVASEAMTSAVAGVPLAPNSIYVAAFGGAAADIGAAIFRKKNPGCNYNGDTVVVVQDPNPAYAVPPSYNVRYKIPTPTPVKFSLAMQINGAVPSNATALIQAAVLAAFNGTDNTTNADGTVNDDAGQKARIATPIFASRYYNGIARLGAWALIYAVKLGLDAPTQDSVLIRGDQIPTLLATDIAVTFS